MKALLLIGLIVVALCIGPMLFLWSVNTLAAAGGSTFYIPHGFWTYLAALVLAVFVGGSSRSSKS